MTDNTGRRAADRARTTHGLYEPTAEQRERLERAAHAVNEDVATFVRIAVEARMAHLVGASHEHDTRHGR
jgi:hypothetical protein